MDNDAMLLMYLAGELPAEEHAQLAQRLAHDPALGEQLERVRALNGGIARIMDEADRGVGATEESRRAAAVRRVSRAMVKQHVTTPAATGSTLEYGQRPRFMLPRWLYPFAAAAVIIGGMVTLVQWGGSKFGDDVGRR